MRQVTIHHMEVGAAHRAGFHRHADLARHGNGSGRSSMLRAARTLWRSIAFIASMKPGFHPRPERLDFPKVGCASLTMALTKIGDQSVLASIIHRPALDDDQIAFVIDIDVRQSRQKRLKLWEDVRRIDPVTLRSIQNLRTLITDDHGALRRCPVRE
jgi:hypothetical protein